MITQGSVQGVASEYREGVTVYGDPFRHVDRRQKPTENTASITDVPILAVNKKAMSGAEPDPCVAVT